MHDYEEKHDQDRRVRDTQARLRRELRNRFDFIVCGAGASGCVVAARLAEDPDAQVLLLEAGGDDMSETVIDPARWPENLGTARDWAFESEPCPSLNGRRLPLNMGRGLGGGSSINVSVWSRGHRSDWDGFAEAASDPAWGYDAVLGLYRRIEDWRGAPDDLRRGAGGPVHVASPRSPQPLAEATLEAAVEAGVPRFDSANGAMMEGPGGVAFAELTIQDGQRRSMFRSYLHPRMHQPNLTVLSGALLTRVVFAGRRATGVEALVEGAPMQFAASAEVILSLGALHSPKVLMQSGIGPEDELRRHGIPVIQHLPGVGGNHQDHIAFGCTWELPGPQRIGGGGCEVSISWRSGSQIDAPDLLMCQLEFAAPAPLEAMALTNATPPEHGWTMFAGLARPRSRGRLRLSGPKAADPILIECNALSAPEDMEVSLRAIELCREIGNGQRVASFSTREVMPGPRDRAGMEAFARASAVTFWHQCGTAAMGRDPMAVVDGDLRVRGLEGIRIADASVMPRITVGNTMAPCVVIGERASDLVRATHGIGVAQEF